MKKGIDCTGVCVVYFCHDGNGNFVMGKRSENARDEHGVWDIGGGGLEFGEEVEENLRKEIREEYSTDALDFKVLVDAKKVSNGEPHKFSEVEWFSLQNLPKDLHSELPRFFEIYEDRI